MSFSWIDILMISIIGLGIYYGLRSNFLTEIFRLMGVSLATCVTLHYYSALAKFSKNYPIVPDGFHDIFAFCLLVFTILTIFSLFTEGWQIILELKFDPLLNKWGGFAFSLVRTYLLAGLVFLGLLVVGHPTLTKQTKESFSQVVFKNTSIGLYKSFYFGFLKPFFPNEHINEDVTNLVEKEKKAWD